MTNTVIEERLRIALAELTDTTTVSPDAWDRMAPRRAEPDRRRWTPLLVAASVSMAIACLVVVAVALRDGSDGRVATQLAPPTSTSSPPTGTTWTTEGDVDGIPWKLTTRRTDDGNITVRFESGTTGGRFGPTTAGRLTPIAVSGGGDPVTFVFGATPPTAASVRLSLPDGTTKSVDVFGDQVGIGGRLFVTSLPADFVGRVRLEALDDVGNAVGVDLLTFVR